MNNELDTVQVTTLDLLRHGACADNSHLRGHTDSILSEQGWQQMLLAVSHWPHANGWQQVLTSPLQRCRVFADKLAQQRQLHCISLESLKEMHFGNWDGLTLEQLQSDHADEYLNFWQQPDIFSPRGGESLADFHRRIGHSLQQILQLHRGQHCLLVTHGGVIRSMIGCALQQPLTHLNRLNIGYAGFCQLQVFHHPEYPDWYQLTRLQPLPEEQP